MSGRVAGPPLRARPLAGIRVVDLTRLIPGALATRKLADLGADVIKIEEPGRGDYLRAIPPIIDGEGVMHRVLNRGKRSVALDYRQPDGVRVLHELIGAADVLVEVSRPGTLAGFGIDLCELRKQHPSLVLCSVTGFGQNGPLASMPSHGMTIDAQAGWVTTERIDGRPAIARGVFTSISVELGGLNAALGILAALVHARATGDGAWLDISCWDSAVEALRYRLATLGATGEDLFDLRDVGPLYDTYTTSDDETVLFAALEEKFWRAFCEGIERPDLIDRWRAETAVQFDDDPALRSTLTEVFATAPAAVWVERFLEWGVPGAHVMVPAGILDDPHLSARGLIVPAGREAIPLILDPIRWADDDSRGGSTTSTSPALGAHTAEVLDEWIGNLETNTSQGASHE